MFDPDEFAEFLLTMTEDEIRERIEAEEESRRAMLARRKGREQQRQNWKEDGF